MRIQIGKNIGIENHAGKVRKLIIIEFYVISEGKNMEVSVL